MIGTLRKILGYSWTSRIFFNRPLLVLAAVFELVSKASGLALPFLLKHLLDCLVDPLLLNSNKTVYFVLGYGILWLLNPLAKTLQVSCKNIVMEKSVNLLIHDIFKHILSLPMKFHLDKKTGTVINTLTQLRQFLSIFWDGFIWLVVPLILEVTAAIVLVSYFYGVIYGFGLFCVLVLYAFINVISARYTTRSQVNLQQKLSTSSAYISDVMLNFETVKSFTNDVYELDRCRYHLEQQRIYARQSGRVMESLGLVQNCVLGLGLTTILIIAFRHIQSGTMVFSDFVLLNTYVLQFSLPMSYLTYAFRDSKQAYIVLKEGLQIFDEKNTISDIGARNLANDRSFEVSFDNVCFGYERATPILKDVSFSVLPGQSLAIVGATGSGKSTISKLLMRYFDIQAGCISINGTDIKEYTIDSLRKTIAIIPQDTILFNDTLYHNVHYGDPSASREEVLSAIRTACLEEYVNSLPAGVDTIVGERGIKLSGGERQRVAIARAILKKPNIYLFDEATSSLDSKTERAILTNLNQISKGITSITIAHRLSTIQNADAIAVLDSGTIVEYGTHTSLVDKKGIYYHYWETQQKNHE